MEVPLRLSPESEDFYNIETLLRNYRMLTLPFPTPGTFNYPMKSFSGIKNLRRVTRHNQRAFQIYMESNEFILENQFLLVGILQQLAINPEWDLDFVVKYTQFRSYSLATVFKINSMSSSGGSIKNGLYGDGCHELWGLVETEMVYEPTTLRFEDLRPVVPVYSTLLQRGYKTTVERNSTSNKNKNEVALIGLNMVELAVGWWMWMRDPTRTGSGITDYLTKHVLYMAQLLHNQSVVINWLYEFFVKGGTTDGFFEMDQVKFTTLSEKKLMKEWFDNRLDFLTSRRLVDIGHLIASVDSLYWQRFFNYETGGSNRLLVQTSWFWQPACIKWYSVYMSLFNLMNYKDAQFKPMLQRILPFVEKSFDKCPSTFCRDHFKGISLELSSAIAKN